MATTSNETDLLALAAQLAQMRSALRLLRSLGYVAPVEEVYRVGRVVDDALNIPATSTERLVVAAIAVADKAKRLLGCDKIVRLDPELSEYESAKSAEVGGS